VKKFLTALLFSFCLLAPAARAAGVKLSLKESGAIIHAGVLGDLTLQPPSLITTDKQELKPSFYVDFANSDTGHATYANGFTVTMTVSNGALEVRFPDPPPEITTLKFFMLLPLNLNQGGRYVLGAKSGEFPAEKTPGNLAYGDAERFEVLHSLGEGIAITAPLTYQQLQDNRNWNWDTFGWSMRYDLRRHRGKNNFVFEVSTITRTTAAAPAFLLDRYGQSARKDYPGKVTSDEQLRADVAAQAAARGSYVGPALDRFGGLAGSGERFGLKATGFFRTDTVEGGRHVLVTPEGNLFFQLGVCGIANTDDFTRVKGRERLYEWLPAANDERFRTAWRDGRPDWGNFSHMVANWIRKYDKPFSYEEWSGQAVERLRAWGFNSAGSFTAYSATMREKNFPYVSFLPTGKNEGVAMLPDKLGAGEVMDPFAPGVAEALDRAYAAALPKSAADPLLVGFFLGNEQHFEALPKRVVAYDGTKVAAKNRLVDELVKKYGDVARFNAAWQPAAPFTSFDEVRRRPLFITTDAAATDMAAFFRLYLDAYYRLIRETFDRHDRNHLLLGNRWTPGTANNEDVVRIGGKYLDVVSVNYYAYAVEKPFLRRIHEWSGRPLILSEWYYSSTEHGLGGGLEVRDQTERGHGYRNYVEQAASTGFVVGSQWFIYADQSITGRFFQGLHGEGNNTGLINVLDRPYEPLVAAARETHSRIYDVLLGKTAAYAYDDPRFSGKSSSGSAKTVSAPPAPAGLPLDGSTAAWPTRPAETIGADRLVSGNPDPRLRGDFRLCWDREALHFLIQVKDPTPGRNDRDPSRYWSADAVELFIGHKNLDQGGTPQYSDRQIVVGVGARPGVHIPDHPDAGAKCRLVVVRDVAGDGYTLQVALPWSVLGFEPRSGMEFLFDVAIDNSDDGTARHHQLVWNGTSKNSSDRSRWGRARLVEN
jgi:Domain of unknown function (DUF1083).